VLVFVPSIGEFLIPELLGGAKGMMIGKFIALKFTGLRHWPLGAAFSLLLMSLVLLLLGVYLWLGGSKEVFQEQNT
jgi:spermidine/putrescine transport system permease protein